jgi:HEPN domain-containing protein
LNRSREHAELLLRKAGQDEFALAELLPNPRCADEVIGFHAQQAVEKLLKAVLAGRGIDYPYTHDLVALIDLLRDRGLDVPGDVENARRLAPFAVELRYDDILEEEEEAFDRSWAADCVKKTREWAERLVGEEPLDGEGEPDGGRAPGE